MPLCGKTKDMLWLAGLGLEVHGIELYREAVESFFRENGAPAPEVTKDADFVHYSSGGIRLSCGDFFKSGRDASYDFLYDRGALVALPAPMRKDYADVVRRSLKNGARYLLIAYEYDASAMESPPFSVDEEEVRRLFGSDFSIRLLEKEKPEGEGPRLSAVESLRQTVYALEKTGGL